MLDERLFARWYGRRDPGREYVMPTDRPVPPEGEICPNGWPKVRSFRFPLRPDGLPGPITYLDDAHEQPRFTESEAVHLEWAAPLPVYWWPCVIRNPPPYLPCLGRFRWWPDEEGLRG